jgi:glucan 1,3-beta-glucosidase
LYALYAPPDNETAMPMDANEHYTMDEKQQQQQQKQQSIKSKDWRVCGLRKRTLMVLSGILLVIVVCAIVIPSVVVSKADRSSPGENIQTPDNDNQGNDQDAGSEPSRPEPNYDNHFEGDDEIYGPGKFNNSARVNARTPPLTALFDYGGNDKIHGVNLGGWLVIEPFITPGLFDQFSPSDHVVDEWTLCAKLGPEQARQQLEHHYQTFITEQDFKKIAEMGLNHVRIPVGHWAVRKSDPHGQEPFVTQLSFKYLLRGIQWARKYGLRVMVELHTAPGSQNGWNHSGKMGSVGFLNGTHGDENAAATLEVVKELVAFLTKPEWAPVATLFGVLNEPAIYRLDKQRVQRWYQESYGALRQDNKTYGPWLTYHEGFLGLSSWNGFFNNKHYERTILGKEESLHEITQA